MKAVVTGSGGLIGSECVRVLSSQGWEVIGIDNDTRRDLFGAAGTTQPVIATLQKSAPSYRHAALDISLDGSASEPTPCRPELKCRSCPL